MTITLHNSQYLTIEFDEPAHARAREASNMLPGVVAVEVLYPWPYNASPGLLVGMIGPSDGLLDALAIVTD